MNMKEITRKDGEIDWTKVPVDTPIKVRNSVNEPFVIRHFAKYEDGCVYIWLNGATSNTIGAVCVQCEYAELALKETEYDEVNHPKRYTGQCSIECIDVMELTFGTQAVINFCMCNAFKYLWRYKAKNGEEDIRKAEWYLDHTVKLLDSDCRLRDKYFEQYDNLCKLYDKVIEKEAKENEE